MFLKNLVCFVVLFFDFGGGVGFDFCVVLLFNSIMMEATVINITHTPCIEANVNLRVWSLEDDENWLKSVTGMWKE